MQDEKYKNPPQLHKQNLSEPRKTGLKRAKQGLKNGVLGVKWGQLDLKKTRASNQTRKAKWCKMQVLCLKTDKQENAKSKKW